MKRVLGKILSLAVIVVLLFVPVACTVPEPEKESSDIVYLIPPFMSEVQTLLDIYRIRLGATNAIFALYDRDLENRMIISSSSPTATGSSERDLKERGFAELFEATMDLEMFYEPDVSNLYPSAFKNELTKADIKSIAACPLVDNRGFLKGYIGFSWSGEAKPPGEEFVYSYCSDASEGVSTLMSRFD